jgi:hypothetical protein
MNTIALTGANEPTMNRVADLLRKACDTAGMKIDVRVGINDAHQASLVYQQHPTSELWRVGADDNRPELDYLVDRWIDDVTPQDLAISTSRALSQYVNKTRISA